MAEKDAANDNVVQTQNEMMEAILNREDDLKKDEALKLCQNHLRGEWLNATLEDIDLQVIVAGFTNRIFICKNMKLVEAENVNASDKSCIIRLYGGKVIQRDKNPLAGGLECEVLTCYLFGDKCIGPELYGVFNGGRLEEYLPTYSTLTDVDVSDPIAMAALARKYARMHNLSIPLSKEPQDHLSFIEKAFSEGLEPFKRRIRPSEEDQESGASLRANEDASSRAFRTFDEFDFVSYVGEIKSIAPKIESKIVLSHNDANRANVMIDRTRPVTVDMIRIIDFECSGYNHRGADIGSHFASRTVDAGKFIKGKFDERLPYPDRSEREHFIAHYLDETRKLGVEMDPRTDTVEHLLLEAEFYGNLNKLLFLASMLNHSEWKDEKDKFGFPIPLLASDVEDLKRSMKIILELLHELSFVMKGQETAVASTGTSGLATGSHFYETFLNPENIDQVIVSASSATDQEPDLAASDEHGEDESSSKSFKETAHDDKVKKKYKTKKNFYYNRKDDVKKKKKKKMKKKLKHRKKTKKKLDKGVDELNDKGKSAKGWKTRYHKEEKGRNKKYHDEKNEKKWGKKRKKWRKKTKKKKMSEKKEASHPKKEYKEAPKESDHLEVHKEHEHYEEEEDRLHHVHRKPKRKYHPKKRRKHRKKIIEKPIAPTYNLFFID